MSKLIQYRGLLCREWIVTECDETYRKFCGAEGFEPVARQYFKE